MGIQDLFPTEIRAVDFSDPFSFVYGMDEWLYGDWNESKYKTYLALDSIYPVHLWMDYLLDKRTTDEYLNRYGLDYTDIHDPRKLSTTGSARALSSYALNYVSRNLDKLYR